MKSNDASLIEQSGAGWVIPAIGREEFQRDTGEKAVTDRSPAETVAIIGPRSGGCYLVAELGKAVFKQGLHDIDALSAFWRGPVLSKSRLCSPRHLRDQIVADLRARSRCSDRWPFRP